MEEPIDLFGGNDVNVCLFIQVVNQDVVISLMTNLSLLN